MGNTPPPPNGAAHAALWRVIGHRRATPREAVGGRLSEYADNFPRKKRATITIYNNNAYIWAKFKAEGFPELLRVAKPAVNAFSNRDPGRADAFARGRKGKTGQQPRGRRV